MMPLAMAKPGETYTIRKVTGKDEVRQHLAELGFVVDGAVTVVSELGGNLILQVKDSRVALDTEHGHPHSWFEPYFRKEREHEDTARCKGGRDRQGGQSSTARAPLKRRIMDMGITKGDGSARAQGGPPGRPHGADCAGV